MFRIKENHILSDYTELIYKDSEIIKGKRTCIGNILHCPKCHNKITENLNNNLPETECMKCGLKMQSFGNKLELW